MWLIRRLGGFPITLFGAVSLVAYVVAAFATTPPGPVIRMLLLPAYVIQLGITSIFGSLLQRVGMPLYWVVNIPLYFAPYVFMDLALSRASQSRPDTQGKGVI